MMDKPRSWRDLSALYEERRKTRDEEITQYNEVEAAIRGILPRTYDDLFSDKDVRLQIRTLRAADDGLSKFLSEIPVSPRVMPRGKRDSADAREKAERVEKIAYGWMNGSALRGGPEIDGITLQLARHQVRFGDGCLLVQPDFERSLVYLEVLDPRYHYPPAGWNPWAQSPLDGTLLVFETTIGEVKRRYCYDEYGLAKKDVLMRLDNAYPKSHGFGDTAAADDARKVKVACYRSREAWLAAILGDNDIVLYECHEGEPNHPGVCGVVSFKQFSSEPLFLGQIGIEAGLMKVINQQIQNTERINQAPMFGPPLVGDQVRWGQYNVIDGNRARQMGVNTQPLRLAPDSPSNLTQVASLLQSLAQTYNYNPESNQGQGNANSGKALQQLQAGPRSLVTNILFSPYKTSWPRVFDDCLEMEINLWPNERRTASSRNGRQSYEVDYTPINALQGYKGAIKIEEARVGGYNAFLEAVQKHDAGMIPLRDVLEADPDIRDVEATIHRIDAESVEKFINGAFEALGASDPRLAIRAAAEVKKRIDDGKSKAEAIQEVLASGLLDPPAPEMPPGLPGAAGPDLGALLGGGGPPELEAGPPPSLMAARGF